MPKKKIIQTSQGFMYKDELEKSTYRAKPKGYEESETISQYRKLRDKCIALMDEGYKLNEIKVMMKL